MRAKCWIVILLCGLACLSGRAQQSSMTDKQVMEFVLKESQRGTDQGEIVTELIRRGVPIEQIRRIRAKYEKERGKDQLGARDLTGASETENRLRRLNGDERDDIDPNAGNYRRRPKRETVDESLLSPRQLEERRNMRTDMYLDEMDFMLPDSAAMYEELFGPEESQGEGRKVFGRNIFNRKNLNFEPEMNIATPDDYRLGPGDAVYVDVWGASQRTFTATVSPEGTIDLEGVGPVNVSGLTVKDANARVRSVLGARYGDSQIRLTVGQTRTISVNVMGEVVMPGTYTLSAFATVFHALYMAGGVNDIGTLRDIKVFRNGRQITSVDVYDYILNGNLKGNVRLASGDVVIVGPYDCLVNITGKVKRPMFYEMKGNESVGTLIKYAGGFTGDAYEKSIRLIRKTGGMYSVFSIDEFERDKFQLADGDSLAIDSVLDRFRNMVEVRGAVFRPGMYQMDGSINTVRELIVQAGGVTEDAITARAVMHRRKADRTLEVLSIDVKGLLDHTVADIPLRNEDVLFVPSKKEVQEEMKLTIEGEVMYPGEYEYADSTTLEDFILQAGGLKDAASTVKVDVSRRIRNRASLQSSMTIAESFSFELKDGFVIDGEPGFVLQPFDEVFVRRSPGYVEQQHVTVEGEVAFAGIYVITKKTQRLSDLVKAAGGLNAEAYPKGARLERQLTPAEILRRQSMLKAISSGDSIDLKKIDMGNTRYIGIDLDKALANPGNDEWDIVLQEGDKLTVPQFNNTVTISGEVMYPNTVAYKPGAKLSYYINQAGGYSLKAKSSRVFAVNMNGTVTRVKSAKDIQPGCEILVPAKRPRRGLSFAEILSLGSVTATLATVVATLVK